MTDSTPQPVIAPALEQALSAGTPVEVSVTFRQVLADDDLEALGLTRGSPAELGVGLLEPAAVRALAQRSDVVNIAERPPIPVGVAAELRNNPKVDARIAERFAADPDQPQSVSIWFVELPPVAELEAIGLVGLDVNPALGVVDAADVARLADRPDVERVVLEPESRPSSL